MTERVGKELRRREGTRPEWSCLEDPAQREEDPSPRWEDGTERSSKPGEPGPCRTGEAKEQVDLVLIARRVRKGSELQNEVCRRRTRTRPKGKDEGGGMRPSEAKRRRGKGKRNQECPGREPLDGVRCAPCVCGSGLCELEFGKALASSIQGCLAAQGDASEQGRQGWTTQVEGVAELAQWQCVWLWLKRSLVQIQRFAQEERKRDEGPNQKEEAKRKGNKRRECIG